MTSDALAPNPVRPLLPLLTLEERRQKLRDRMLSLLQEAGNRLFHSSRISMASCWIPSSGESV